MSSPIRPVVLRAPRPIRAAAVALLLLLAGIAAPAGAQEDVWVPEIPLTRDTGMHARALGMGGAYLAVSDDCAALRYNPAGLARVQRIELTGSLLDISRETDNEFHGTRQKAELARTHVTGLGFVYPFPTYRGSMVIALGYSVPWILDRDYRRRAAWGSEVLEETLFEEGSIGQWSFGYAVDVSPRLSLGFRASWIRGTRMQDWVFERSSSGATIAQFHDINDIDLSGYTGSLGALARVGGWGRLGLVIDLPRWIHMEGTLSALAEGNEYLIAESMTLPFSAGVGFAVARRRLLLAADARFTDWSQIDYEGPLRYTDETGRYLAYQRTWNLHIGAEYLLELGDAAGLRLRAGYAREPVPYGILFEDISVGNSSGDPVYRQATFDPNRDAFTFGIGMLIEQSVTIDAAYVMSGFKRTGEDLTEEESERRLLLTAAFRLQ